MLQRDHFAILSTFIKLPFVIEIFILSIFEWTLKTSFTVYNYSQWVELSMNIHEERVVERVIFSYFRTSVSCSLRELVVSV